MQKRLHAKELTRSRPDPPSRPLPGRARGTQRPCASVTCMRGAWHAIRTSPMTWRMLCACPCGVGATQRGVAKVIRNPGFGTDARAHHACMRGMIKCMRDTPGPIQSSFRPLSPPRDHSMPCFMRVPARARDQNLRRGGVSNDTGNERLETSKKLMQYLQAR